VGGGKSEREQAAGIERSYTLHSPSSELYACDPHPARPCGRVRPPRKEEVRRIRASSFSRSFRPEAWEAVSAPRGARDAFGAARPAGSRRRVVPGLALRCSSPGVKLRGERLKRLSRGPSRRCKLCPSCPRAPAEPETPKSCGARGSLRREERARPPPRAGCAPGSRHHRRGGEPRGTACEAGLGPHPAPLQDASGSAPHGQDAFLIILVSR
jgi:hypothetical protein